MAQLKDSVVSGNLRVTDTTLTDTLQVTTIKAPTSSGGTTYGPGTSGQVLKSNGATAYWTSDSNTDEKVKATKLAQSTAETSYYPTLVTGTGTAGVSIFDSAKINHTPGTTSVVGNTRLILGNATNEGTADNEEGLLRIYSSGTKYHTLQFAKITNDHITHTFPTTGGTILNTGNYTSYTIPFAKVTGSADADTYAANTGWYNWNTTTGTNMPSENWGILLSKEYPSVQMFLPDTGNAIYLRKKTNASTAGSSWMTIRGTAGVDYNLASFVSSSTLNDYLRLSGGTMTGDIEYVGDGNRKIALGYNSFKYYVASNAGWAGGLSYYSNDGSTGLGYFGAYGQANTLEYHFIGGTFSAPQIKIEPSGPNLIINSEDASSPRITFFRKGNNKADWRIVNTGGNLKFQSDYTTTVGDWYDALTVEYNTGNITMKTDATFTFGKFGSASANANRHVFFKEDGANRICVNDNFKYNPSTNILTVGSITGNAATATTASKLSNTSAIGDSTQPVYFNASGVPVACNRYTSTTYFNIVPFVNSDGVMEIGKRIDFHSTNPSENDYDVRLLADSDSTFGFIFKTPANSSIVPSTSNQTSLGTSSLKWSNVYATTFYGALSGNATTSSSWATARTLTLGGQLTGSVSVKGNANMTLNGYLDRAFIYDDNAVPSGHTWDEYAWHKFAEVTITDEFEDRVITFLVSRTHGSSAGYTGILSAKLRTKENKVYDSAQLKWLVRNYGLSEDDFVMVYTSTSGTSTKAELWCRLPGQYHGLVFTVLKEHRRNDSASSDWTLVKTPKGSSTHGSSSYPTTGITDTIISSDGIITNSTTGTATSANALNLTNKNELNFSKLESTGHVWFGYRWNTQGTETSGGTTITTYKFGNANGPQGLAGLEARTAQFTDSNFGQIHVVRSGSTNAASIKFSNSNGVIGAIGMTGNVDTALIRWNHDTSISHTILDTGNTSVTTSGSGNAITALSFSNGTFTATKGSTFSLDGHDNKCTVTNGSTTSTNYGIVFATNPNTTQNNTLRKTNDFRYQMKDGVANTEGFASIVLGNTKKLSEANNKSGNIYLYSSGGNWHLINTTSTASNITHTLPATSGTILNSGTTSFTRTLSSGTKIGTIKINGTSTDLYYDNKVKQSETTTQYYRPLVLGAKYSSNVSELSQTVTDETYTTTKIYAQPFTGTIFAYKLVLGTAKTTDGAQKGQLKFFSGNASDATGTVTLECINDVTRTDDYTVKLPTWNGTIPVFEKLFDGALGSVSLSYSDIDEYDVFLITVANSNATSEQVTVTSLWISNVAGVHDMSLIWGGAPTSSGGSCNVTSGWIQLSKNSGTTTFNIGHKTNVAQMTSSGWTISSPTYNLYIRKIFGLKAYKRT